MIGCDWEQNKSQEVQDGFVSELWVVGLSDDAGAEAAELCGGRGLSGEDLEPGLAGGGVVEFREPVNECSEEFEEVDTGRPAGVIRSGMAGGPAVDKCEERLCGGVGFEQRGGGGSP